MRSADGWITVINRPLLA